MESETATPRHAGIVEIVQRYVDLRPSGKTWKGRCPFHAELTPSFSVSDERHAFKCFGCGAQGGAVDFVARIEGIGHLEAVTKLAKLYGIGE